MAYLLKLKTEVIEKKWANNRCNYSPQEELGILVDFHNLSIDQMREKYKGLSRSCGPI